MGNGVRGTVLLQVIILRQGGDRLAQADAIHGFPVDGSIPKELALQQRGKD